MELDDDIKKIMAADKWLNLEEIHIKRVQDAIAKNGIEPYVTLKFTIGIELIKLLIYEGLGNEEPYKSWLRKLWLKLDDNMFSNLMNKLFPTNRRWLVVNGYLNDEEVQLNKFVCRANELEGINLNMNLGNSSKSHSNPADEPPPKRIRLEQEISPMADTPTVTYLSTTNSSQTKPFTPFVINSMDDLSNALKRDEVRNLFLSIHSQNETKTYSDTIT